MSQTVPDLVPAGDDGSGTPERAPAAAPSSEAAGPPRPRRERGRLRWWREVFYIAAFYAVYSVVRNTQGSATVSAAHALHNATRVIRVEHFLGIYRERAIQHAFLGDRVFIEFWNLFYGTFHFVVTAFAVGTRAVRAPA